MVMGFINLIYRYPVNEMDIDKARRVLSDYLLLDELMYIAANRIIPNSDASNSSSNSAMIISNHLL